MDLCRTHGWVLREQRPDLDEIYMSFTTALTGHGGWPMSVFLTPDLLPFYAGTYFPPKRKYGRPGFSELLELIGEYGIESGEDFWVYFTSPHPRDMTDEVIEVIDDYTDYGLPALDKIAEHYKWDRNKHF